MDFAGLSDERTARSIAGHTRVAFVTGAGVDSAAARSAPDRSMYVKEGHAFADYEPACR
jgi:hypothetical protein